MVFIIDIFPLFFNHKLPFLYHFLNFPYFEQKFSVLRACRVILHKLQHVLLQLAFHFFSKLRKNEFLPGKISFCTCSAHTCPPCAHKKTELPMDSSVSSGMNYCSACSSACAIWGIKWLPVTRLMLAAPLSCNSIKISDNLSKETIRPSFPKAILWF